MKEIESYLILFGILFLVIFLIHYFFITKPVIQEILGKRKKKKQKNAKKISLGEIDYLVNKFKLDKNKLNYQALSVFIPLIDALIIAFVTVVIELINLKIIWRLLIGFVLLFALIYSLYEIYGRSLLKKQQKGE